MKSGSVLYIVLSLLVFWSGSCKKKEEPKVVGKAKGRLLNTCNGSPESNKSLEFWQNFVNRPWPNEDIPDKLLVSFTTDGNGFFEFEMQSNNASGSAPANASIRFTDNVGVLRLADGDFHIKEGQTTIDVGNLYTGSASDQHQMVFQNDQSFVSGDRIILMCYNVPNSGLSVDTITGSPGKKWTTTKALNYRTKRLYKDSLPENWKYEVKVIVRWDFKSQDDISHDYILVSKGCGNHVDSLFFKP